MVVADIVTGTVPPLTQQERLASAEAVVRRNVLWGFGTGVLPLPMVDLVAATVVQLKLIKELSNVYGVAFREGVAKKLLASLVSSALGMGIGVALAVSAAKFIPGVGTALGAVATPVVLGATTYAVGNVFIMHFESGGTLLDFDAAAMRAHFRAEFESGKDVVAKIYEEEKSRPASHTL